MVASTPKLVKQSSDYTVDPYILKLDNIVGIQSTRQIIASNIDSVMLRDLIVNSIVRFSLQNNKYIVGFVKDIDESSTKKYPVLMNRKNKSWSIMVS